MSYIQSLTVFLQVAEEGSFSAAAKKLDLTQPTVSFHIDNLEKNIGCPLFTRTSKGVSLTIYGEKLYETARKIDTLIAGAHNEIKAMKKGEIGQIILGASSIPADYILPPLLADFLTQHPGVKVTLVTGDSQYILDKFDQGEIPIAIVGSKPDAKLASIPLWTDRLLLVAHPSFKAVTDNSSASDWLANIPFIWRKKSSGTAGTALEALERLGIKQDNLNVVMEVGSNQSVKAAILNRIGVGFISEWAVENELKSGQLTTLELPGPIIERRFYAVSRQLREPSCLDLFWRYITSRGQ